MVGFELLGTLAFGAMTAGVLLIAFRLAGRRAPLALLLAGAGLAMLSFAIWTRYAWAPRVVGALPASVVVIERTRAATAWEPWTLLVPRTEGLALVDRRTVRRHQDHPALRWASVLFVERATPDPVIADRLIDCAGHRWTAITPQTAFDDTGLPLAPEWVAGGTPAALFSAVCDSP
ncbi:hypothetical protein [Pararhodospirillum oryzae]|uniref:Uncharacterized protein n=1 Tax=Pararhodospirillum oryzae TaxID=478448 RepID=A0A512H8M6_9PROT|nr:hypothetical protein [Pararhodospirillum oryzae]GEO81804.1 hypothetical protein ROR02_19350 [Pararhodospirillum oryzae]